MSVNANGQPQRNARANGLGSGHLGAAFAGVVATAAAMAAGELAAGLLPGAPSPILAVGKMLIDYQPSGAKDVVVSLFGTNDKLALQVLVLLVALAVGAGLGILGRTRPTAAMSVLGGFVVVGVIAGLRDPATSPVLAVGAGLGELAVGAFVLDRLLGLVGRRSFRSSGKTASMPDWSRRTLLLQGGAIAIGSLVVGAIGRSILTGRRAPTTGGLPTADVPATLPSGADLAINGLTPIVVPNADFYRIDTALLTPNVDRDTWKLRIHGMVDHEVEPDLRGPDPAADHRPVRDDRMRQQRGRGRPRRKRPLDGRAAS